MKPHVSNATMSRAQKDALYSYAKTLAEGMVTRIHWIMILAMMDEFGIGKKRMDRYIKRYTRYVDEYSVLRPEDSADDILLLRIRQRKLADIYKF